MSGLPWYAFYPADYARDTGHLSMLEHGAYRLLMDQYYSLRRPLPTDVERTLKLCRASSDPERAAVTFILNEFFLLSDDGWHHKRIDEELQKTDAFRENCSKAGKASAAKRQQKSNGRSTSVSTTVATNVQQEVQQEVQPEGNKDPNRNPTTSQSQSQKEEKKVPLPKEGNGHRNGANPKKLSAEAMKAHLYARGKEVFGPSGGGLITIILQTFDGDVYKSLMKVEDAAKTDRPREWMGAFLHKNAPSGTYVGPVAPQI